MRDDDERRSRNGGDDRREAWISLGFRRLHVTYVFVDGAGSAVNGIVPFSLASVWRGYRNDGDLHEAATSSALPLEV